MVFRSSFRRDSVHKKSYRSCFSCNEKQRSTAKPSAEVDSEQLETWIRSRKGQRSAPMLNSPYSRSALTRPACTCTAPACYAPKACGRRRSCARRSFASEVKVLASAACPFTTVKSVPRGCSLLHFENCKTANRL